MDNFTSLLATMTDLTSTEGKSLLVFVQLSRAATVNSSVGGFPVPNNQGPLDSSTSDEAPELIQAGAKLLGNLSRPIDNGKLFESATQEDRAFLS